MRDCFLEFDCYDYLVLNENKAPLNIKQIQKNIWANVGVEHMQKRLHDAIIYKLQIHLNVNICFLL